MMLAFCDRKLKRERMDMQMETIITEQMLGNYVIYLKEEEKSTATISKYLCDLRKLTGYAAGRALDKGLVVAYKESLSVDGKYKASSINSFLVAANRFFEFMGWHDLKVKSLKVQKEVFCPEKECLSRGEYFRLVRAAKEMGKKRTAMVLQTICATGIRVSELQAITVAAVRNNSVVIRNKGKIRTILLPDDLRKELLYYISREGIKKGVVFCTSSGKAVNRSNVWKEMKSLCNVAGVEPGKVFPHSLRRLFARCFYTIKKDIAKLADILGHSNIETTRIYIKSTGREHRKQMNQMKLVDVP